jgi:hypothetical protein
MSKQKVDRNEIIAQLKKNHIVYGSEYTVQCSYLWEGEYDILDLRNKKPSHWAVCKNHQIDVYNDGTRFELCPVPIETFEGDEMEKAADRFIELEYGDKSFLRKFVIVALTAGIGIVLFLILLSAVVECV